MLYNIINAFCSVTGMDPVQQRNSILDYVNRGAKDLYNGSEADAFMREIVLIVPAGQRLSLPPFMGELRGMREYNWTATIPLYEIGVPRYSSDTWKYKWRNWTLVGKQPLATSISNAGPLTVTTTSINTPPDVVTIVGSTATANAVTESVTLSVLTATTTNSFATIKSISSMSLSRPSDITISDLNGVTLATLYNNEQKTAYLIVDVSQYQWIAQFGDGLTTLVEVLYKDKFYKFFNDTDEYNAEGYDDAIAYKAIALWYMGKEGKEQDAMLYEQKAKIVCDSNVWSHEKGQKLQIQMASNKVYNHFKRIRTTLAWSRNNSWRW